MAKTKLGLYGGPWSSGVEVPLAEIIGSLTKTLGALTVSSTGTLLISGSSLKTLGSITLNSAGAFPVSGALLKSLGSLTLSSDTDVFIAGTSTKTLGSLTSISDVDIIIGGVTLRTLGDLVLISAGTVADILPAIGTLDVTLGVLVLDSASGMLQFKEIDADDLLTGNPVVPVKGTRADAIIGITKSTVSK